MSAPAEVVLGSPLRCDVCGAPAVMAVRLGVSQHRHCCAAHAGLQPVPTGIDWRARALDAEARIAAVHRLLDAWQEHGQPLTYRELRQAAGGVA